MTYKHLVFEGASFRLYAYIGVCKVLEDNNILNNITHFLGTSSGGIIALMLSLGYTSDEIKKTIFKINPSDYYTYSNNNFINYFYKLFNLFKISTKYGCIHKEKYISFFKELIKNKTGNSETTFKELYELTGHILILTGTCINKRETHYYNHISNPDMKLYDAIYITTALPYLFEPYKWDNDILVDGGILENFPIYYIAEDSTFLNSKETIVRYCNNSNASKNTLGVKILNKDYSKNDPMYYIGNDLTVISNIQNFTIGISNTMLTQIERANIKKGYFDNTIIIEIPAKYDNIYNILRTEEEKEELYNLGIKFCNIFNQSK